MFLESAPTLFLHNEFDSSGLLLPTVKLQIPEMDQLPQYPYEISTVGTSSDPPPAIYTMVATMAGKAGKAGMAGKAGKAGNSYIFNPFALSGWNLVLFSVHSRFPIYVCIISLSSGTVQFYETF